MIHLKICGMKYPQNIESVLKFQPNYMGFIFYAKSPRYVSEEYRPAIRQLDFRKTKKVGVFVQENILSVLKTQNEWQLDFLQLHGGESPEYCRQLKAKGMKIIKVFHPDQSFSANTLHAFDSVADFYLFDTKTKNYGGSGKLFDWSILQKNPPKKPFFLSGGIGPDEINEALVSCQNLPLHGIDINSRIEIKVGLKSTNDLQFLSQKIKNHGKHS